MTGPIRCICGVVLIVWIGMPAPAVGQLPNCTINFDDTCPDVTPECGATFVGGDGCNIIGEANCYSSGLFSYQVADPGGVTITLSDDLNSVSVFFAHQVIGGAGIMTFLDSGGQQVDDPLLTDGPCASGPMPPTHVLFFSRAVRSIEVANTGVGNLWIDTVEMNPPCGGSGDCDDADACTTDACDGGACTHTPLDCDDSDPCNGVETCDSVAGCQDGTPVDCSGAGDQCNTASCDPGGAPGNCAILTPVPDGTECNDGDSCNANDQCTGGVCAGMGGCDDENACTTDECVNDECVFTGVDCSGAGDQCNSASCDPDGTDGNCDTLTPLPDGTECDDGDASTNDACVDGTCVSSPSTGDCPADLDGDGEVGAFDLANLLGSWGANVGHPADLTGDGSVGAEDLANLLGSWGPCPSSSAECQNDEDCDDDNACTENDQCFDGACVGGAPLDCDDLDPCTDDSCDEAEGCQHDNNTAPCDDDDACTEGDVCTAGSCGGSAVDCSLAGDQCNDASCDPDGADGNCGILTPLADDTPCDDDDACTEGDVCTAGSCGGSAVDCSLAGDQCNDASCDPDGADGNCDILTPVADDTLCDDEDGMMDDEEMDSNGCGAGSCGAAGGMSFAWILAALSAARVARRRGWPAGKR